MADRELRQVNPVVEELTMPIMLNVGTPSDGMLFGSISNENKLTVH